MSDQPLTTGGLRGAIDLTALRSQPSSGAPSASAGAAAAGAGASSGGSGPTASSATPGVAGRTGAVVEGTDANFQEVANASVGVPMLLVLWAAQIPESRDYLDTIVAVAGSYEGRFQVVSVNVEQNPTLLRAFQVQSVPVTIGLIQGQPVPMFAGSQPESALRPVLDEFLGLAVQHGVTGRVDVADAGVDTGEGDEVEEQLPPLHQEAFDSIERGDLEGAVTAYQEALKQNPADADAELGLAQVGLMQRTEGADLQAARAAAAEHPTDVAAQGLVADLDVLGGHVEDAFLRLIDLVRATSGEEREQAKNHLLQLFAVVGSHDERVRKARTALMSALF
jgi:putative thioredoxin